MGGMSDAGDMLKSAKRLEGEGRTDAALDMVYDMIDDLLCAGQFDECDRLLNDADPDGCSTDILLCLLTATLPASDKLPRREKLMGLARKVIRRRGLDAEELLAGLEGECPDSVRAGGDVVCPSCGKVYYDHPQHGGFPFLNVLCDGKVVKL